MKRVLFYFTLGLTLASCTASNTDKAINLMKAASSCNIEEVKSISPSMTEMFALGCQPREIKGELTAKSYGNVGSNGQELIGLYLDGKLSACVQSIKDSDHLAPYKKLTACKKAEKNAKKAS